MSTPHTITVVAPRLRIRPATLLTAFGVLVAIAVSIVILAVTGADRTTATSPVAASQTTSGSTPHVHYLGPRQMSATLNPQITQTQSSGTRVAHWTCLGAAERCFR